MKCFVKVNIPCLSDIQNEILNILPTDYKVTRVRGVIVNKKKLKEHCPILYNWLLTHSKKILDTIRPVKIYFCPPNTGLKAHIDLSRSPISLNIPIQDVEDTKYVFYFTEHENLEKPKFESKSSGLNLEQGLTAIDESKMILLDTLELTEPHLIRTHILHGVINNTDKTRIIIAINWASNSLNFEDYLKIDFKNANI